MNEIEPRYYGSGEPSQLLPICSGIAIGLFQELIEYETI